MDSESQGMVPSQDDSIQLNEVEESAEDKQEVILVDPETSTARAQEQVEQSISISRYNYVDISTIPTLFPAPIAGLITALATSARISLRLSAFFIETILETSQYSTRLSLGYTRRLLVTALSSARRVYLISNSAADGNLLSLVGYDGQSNKPAPSSTDGFLQVLDKYTNLGIYIIHHTFTLAELFAMSGFYLTANAVQSAHYAAQESVALFDGLFGSNESSRALSAIISMVRRELLEDERFKAMDKGKIATLTALTKALTAFACLQNATWTKTATKFRMKMLYDCTVLKEKDESFSLLTAMTAGSSNATAGPGPNTLAQRQARDEAMEEINGRLWAHLNAAKVTGKGNIGRSDSGEEDMSIQDLVNFEGIGKHGTHPNAAGNERKRRKKRAQEVYEITEEYREAIEVTQTFERHRADHLPDRSSSSHRRLQSAPLLSTLNEAKSPDGDVSPGPRHTLATDLEGEWVEIDQAFDEDLASIPSSPNGRASVGDASVHVASEPTHTSEKVQLVLRTMTNKLLSTKRIIRSISHEEASNSEREFSPKKLSSVSRDIRAVSSHPTPNHPLKVAPSAAWSSFAATPTMIGAREANAAMKFTHRSGSPARIPLPKAVSKGRAFRPSARAARRTRTPSPVPPSSTEEFDVDDDVSMAVPLKVPPPSPVARPRVINHPDQNKTPPNTVRNHRRSHRRLPSMSTVYDSVQRSSQSRYQGASAENMPTTGTDTPEKLFPHDTLLNNIHRFMKCSSAAYGQNFLRIFGMGSTEFSFPSTGKHHANTWSFAQHTNLPIESIILTSYAESSPTFGQVKAPPLVHYLAVDHKLGAIILTCRGTLGLSDVLIDLTCEYCEVKLEGADAHAEYFAHSGMYRSALSLTSKKSTVHEALSLALEQNPAYGLIVTGHSLGGGVAGLLSIACSMPANTFLEQNALRPSPVEYPPISTPFVTSFTSGLPPGRPIHCYTYGVPAITSSDLAEYSKGLITSVIHNQDVVPCLSLGVLRDLKNVALTLFEEGNVAEEIVGRVMGVYQRKLKLKSDDKDIRAEAGETQEELTSDWMLSLINTMRADMDSDKLYPPGDVYIMEYHDVFVTVDGRGGDVRHGDKTVSHKQAHRATLHKCDSVKERFREPVFSKTMLNDHLPMHYERATQLLMEGAARSEGEA